MAINKISGIDTITSVFANQADIVVGFVDESNSLFNYDGLTDATELDALFSVPKSLGQVVEDSTEWNGDEPETTPIKDEQGNVITTQVTAGTMAFTCEAASLSPAMLGVFMKAEELDAVISKVFDGTMKASAFGHNLPVITAPIMIVNGEQNKALVFPKAKIVSNFSYSDKLWRIALSVTAEDIDTAKLKTGMLLHETVAE